LCFNKVGPRPEEATNGSRECAPDDRLRAVSKDGQQYRFVIPGTRPLAEALLVKLGYDAEAEKRLAGLVCNFHPPFRTNFNWMVQITQYFAGGFYRFQLNCANVGEFDSVAIVRDLVTVTDHKKVFWHVSQPFPPHFKRANLGLCVQNCSHPEIICGVFRAAALKIKLEHDPEKHALGLDPRVGTGFPSGQTRSVCPEIMLNQKDRAGWRFEEKSSRSRPPGGVETGWQRGPPTAPRSLERYRDQSDLPMLPNPAPGLIVQAIVGLEYRSTRRMFCTLSRVSGIFLR
jgi:hypothetical protein